MQDWDAVSIVVGDRIIRGQRPNKAGPEVERQLKALGVAKVHQRCVGEGREPLVSAFDWAAAMRPAVIVIAGGTGLNPGNVTPEISMEYIIQRLYGLEMQVLIQGLEHTEKAGLSRGVIGIARVGNEACLLINTPSSRGGVCDVFEVIAGVWDSIAEALDSHREADARSQAGHCCAGEPDKDESVAWGLQE
ncbi:molybdopterin-binding protein [Corynebacterium pelargi]|uniref:Bifunctional molybdenum cofactor biosynthesis protein MoaC/MogA n=1 Tax=Corynebacterium pelargi TaxID=1471400 RepID=A0A410W9H5_9CORY|nr:molybdopterin-binding protein [Corynebacterium pelargi]QAU52596.1 bifunctional molybdenum cofactor biosynthesis protein MoaC/MogA [Corynebacterium pelargi]GGG77547.1 putative molybdopterin biosynthesis protein [Corynebacterium pelargi]